MQIWRTRDAGECCRRVEDAEQDSQDVSSNTAMRMLVKQDNKIVQLLWAGVG